MLSPGRRRRLHARRAARRHDAGRRPDRARRAGHVELPAELEDRERGGELLLGDPDRAHRGDPAQRADPVRAHRHAVLEHDAGHRGAGWAVRASWVVSRLRTRIDAKAAGEGGEGNGRPRRWPSSAALRRPRSTARSRSTASAPRRPPARRTRSTSRIRAPACAEGRHDPLPSHHGFARRPGRGVRSGGLGVAGDSRACPQSARRAPRGRLLPDRGDGRHPDLRARHPRPGRDGRHRGLVAIRRAIPHRGEQPGRCDRQQIALSITRTDEATKAASLAQFAHQPAPPPTTSPAPCVVRHGRRDHRQRDDARRCQPAQSRRQRDDVTRDARCERRRSRSTSTRRAASTAS